MSWCIRILFLIVEGSKLNVFFWNQLGLVPNSKKCVLEEKSRILDIYRVRYGPSKSYPKIRQQLKSMKYKLLSLEHLKMVVLLQKELYQPSNNMSIKKIYKAYNRLHMQKLKKNQILNKKQKHSILRVFSHFLEFMMKVHGFLPFCGHFSYPWHTISLLEHQENIFHLNYKQR